MPEYNVCITLNVTKSEVVTVKARSKAKAEEKAFKMYKDNELTDFQEDDNPPLDEYVSWSEKT